MRSGKSVPSCAVATGDDMLSESGETPNRGNDFRGLMPYRRFIGDS